MYKRVSRTIAGESLRPNTIELDILICPPVVLSDNRKEFPGDHGREFDHRCVSITKLLISLIRTVKSEVKSNSSGTIYVTVISGSDLAFAALQEERLT